MSERAPKKRMWTMLLIGAGLLAAVVLAAIVIVALQVENWRRDLTTNVAMTEESSPDERLRPVHAPLDPAELAERTEKAGKTLANWRLESSSREGSAVKLYFVRTTRLMRFQDDIHVRIEPATEGGSVLSAVSRSRVGKGDLGQNPRNLRELLAAVRQAIR